MSYGSAEQIEALRKARAIFLKHIDGITPEQATWKPYPDCKSIAETLEHLLWSDQESLKSLQTGEEPDFSANPDGPPTRSAGELKSELAQSHTVLMNYLSQTYGESPLDTPVNNFGTLQPLGQMLVLLINEEGYHSGQAAFIRMATDPDWDYFKAVYG